MGEIHNFGEGQTLAMLVSTLKEELDETDFLLCIRRDKEAQWWVSWSDTDVGLPHILGTLDLAKDYLKERWII